MPLTSGFLAKFYVISAAVEARSYALAIIAMVAAVIAAFFYLRIVIVMYARPEGAEDSPAATAPVPIAVGAGVSLAIALGFTLVVGFLPSAVFDFARHATLLRL